MGRLIRRALLAVAAAGLSGCPPSSTAPPGPRPPTPWRALFDGRSLAGWKVLQGTARCDRGAILLNAGGRGKSTVLADDLRLKHGLVHLEVLPRYGRVEEGVYTIGLRTTPGLDWSSVYCVCRADSLEVCRGSAVRLFPPPEVRASFPPADDPQQWCFVMSDGVIDCYRLGRKVLRYADTRPVPGTIAITADNCELLVRSVRCLTTQEPPGAELIAAAVGGRL